MLMRVLLSVAIRAYTSLASHLPGTKVLLDVYCIDVEQSNGSPFLDAAILYGQCRRRRTATAYQFDVCPRVFAPTTTSYLITPRAMIT